MEESSGECKDVSFVDVFGDEFSRGGQEADEEASFEDEYGL